ncbi:hypothetical protein ACIPSE_29625 [Streptomyces sp. NPDC090106]|uniref:hypothetical protein n=1 Tax=Streptomyces sp. NPDC090106 TaxID=3365946 RepID=UPI003806707B
MAFNVLSLVLSAVALVASTWGIGRQVARSRADGDRAWTTELLLTHVRDREFQEDQRWVLTRLAAEHSPDGGFNALPEEVAYRVWNVAVMFEAICITQYFDIVSDSILTSLTHYRLMRTWEAIEPFVLAERAHRGSVVFPFFEHAYATARRTDPDALYRRLGLLRADGTPR